MDVFTMYPASSKLKGVRVVLPFRVCGVDDDISRFEGLGSGRLVLRFRGPGLGDEDGDITPVSSTSCGRKEVPRTRGKNILELKLHIAKDNLHGK